MCAGSDGFLSKGLPSVLEPDLNGSYTHPEAGAELLPCRSVWKQVPCERVLQYLEFLSIGSPSSFAWEAGYCGLKV